MKDYAAARAAMEMGPSSDDQPDEQ
jgi:hypothetical protein